MHLITENTSHHQSPLQKFILMIISRVKLNTPRCSDRLVHWGGGIVPFLKEFIASYLISICPNRLAFSHKEENEYDVLVSVITRKHFSEYTHLF